MDFEQNDKHAGAAGAAPGPAASAAAPYAQPPAARLALWRWAFEGLRATFFLPPRTACAAPAVWQLLVLALLAEALTLAAQRLQLAGPARLDLRDWAPAGNALLLLWLAWWAMPAARANEAALAGALQDAHAPSGGLAAWYALLVWSALLPVVLRHALTGAWARWSDQWGQILGGSPVELAWFARYTLLAWSLAIMVVLGARFIRSPLRAALFTMGLAAVFALGIWQTPPQPWAASGQDEEEAEPAYLRLSQTTFEGQQALWQRQVDALAPQQPGVVDVYALVFAPYAGEDVFRNESSMVAELLQQRFDAHARVLHLLNHAETAASHPWATPQNLQRAITALAARMDREQDLLLVYLTSHGARDHKLEAANWPLEVAPVTPEMLRTALDGAAIRNRVIVVSACYAGGWIAPLASADSLVMTAADATHTSYGCGALSDLTFFGRAVFDEQLRQTHSFTQAFSRAVPLIAQREKEAGKEDGFSNPQIHVGAQIAPLLRALEQRLDAGAGNDAAAGAHAAEASVPASAPDSVPASAPASAPVDTGASDLPAKP